MAKTDVVSAAPGSALAIPSPRTKAMPQNEADQKFASRLKAAEKRLSDLDKMGLTVSRSGNTVLLTSEDIKVSVPYQAMYDDTAFNSYRLGLAKKLYDAEDRMIGKEAVWAAIAQKALVVAERILAKAEATIKTT